MNRGITTVLLAGALLLVVGCKGGSRQPAPPPQAPKVDTNPDGFGLVIVSDTSGSMDNNDPRAFNKEGAHLAVGLTSSTDNLGLISFASDIKTSVPLEVMRDPSKRNALSKVVDGLSNRGKTDFIAALTEARDLLDAPGLSEDSAVILLSDGEHNPERGLMATLATGNAPSAEEDRQTILGLAGELRERGARVFTVALSAESDPAMLQQIAAASGGAAYQVPRAEDLVDAYLEILGDVYGLFRYDRNPNDLNVSRTSRRLIYLLVKPAGNNSTSLDGRITKDGQVVNLGLSASYRRPPSPKATFDVVQFSDGLEGRWRCDVPAGGGKVIVLSNVPMSFQIVEGSPAAEVQVGHPLEFGIEALCDDASVARDAERELTVSARIYAGDKAGPEVTLTPKRQGNKLTFTGQTTAVRLLGDGDEPEAQLARFEIRLGDAGWVHKKTASYNVVALREPPPPPEPTALEDAALAVSTPVGAAGSGVEDMGDFWEGEVDFSVPMDLRNDFDTPMQVSFAVQGGVVAAIAPIELAPGESTQVALVPNGAPTASGQRGKVTVTATAAGSEGTATRSVDVAYDVYRVSVGAVNPPGVAAGSETELAVATAFGGPSGTTFELSTPKVTSAVEGVEASWPTTLAGALAVPVTTPEFTPGGTQVTELRARPAGTQLEPRPLVVSFDVQPSAPRLAVDAPATFTVSLGAPKVNGDWVLIEQPITVKLEHHGKLELQMSLTSLDGPGQSFGNPDLRLVGSTELTPGEELQVQLDINLSANRTAGTYKGTLKLAVFDGELEDVQEIEITVEVVK